MPAEYAEYLAANVLNEQQLVCSLANLRCFAQLTLE